MSAYVSRHNLCSLSSVVTDCAKAETVAGSKMSLRCTVADISRWCSIRKWTSSFSSGESSSRRAALSRAASLQVFDGAQRMLVHRVAMVEIAHYQRIDHSEFRQDFHQQSQPLHRPQGHARIIGAENLAQRSP